MNTQPTIPLKCRLSATGIAVRFAVIMATLAAITVAFTAVGAVMVTFSDIAAIIWGVATGAVIAGTSLLAAAQMVVAFRERH